MQKDTMNINEEILKPDRILRRGEAGRLLSRSPKTIDRLAEKGILQRVRFPGCINAAGYRLSDLQRLIASVDRQDGYAVGEQ